MPTLPVSPEPLADAQARLPAALENVFQAGRTDSSRPGAQPEQVFDVAEHGIRYIVSREAHPDTGHRVLHVSMSVFNEAAAIDMRGLSRVDRIRQVADWLVALFGQLPDVREMQIQPNGIIHIMCEDMTAAELREGDPSQAPGDGP